jgi:hypothetical protein
VVALESIQSITTSVKKVVSFLILDWLNTGNAKCKKHQLAFKITQIIKDIKDNKDEDDLVIE